MYTKEAFNPNAPFVLVPRQTHKISGPTHPFWESITNDAPIDRYLHNIFYTGDPSALGKENLEPIPRADHVRELRHDWTHKLQGNHHLTKRNVSTISKYRQYQRNPNTTEEKFRLHVPASDWFKRHIEELSATNGAENYPMYHSNRRFGVY